MVVYGLDYGTSNSSISYFDEKKKKVIFQTISLPSLISFLDDRILVGIDIPNVKQIRYPKRELSLDNKESILHSKLILNKIRESTNEEFIDAVVTIPVYYNHAQREATRVACKLANINVIRFLNEPTAVAVAFNVKENNILILDIGAGTSDISILEFDPIENLYEVIYTAGDSCLGGDDINQILYKQLSTLVALPDYAKCYNLIEEGKKKLLVNNYVTIFSYKLTRQECKLWCASFLKKVMSLLENCMQKNTVEKILLAGGGSNLFFLREEINKQFPNIYIYQHDNPSTLVSYGASIFGYSLNYNKKNNDFLENKITLIDILPLCIGVKTEMDVFVPIIESGSIIPIKRSKVFGISEDEQFIDIEIYQGNRSHCIDNYSIGKIQIDLLTKRKKSEPRIEVTFGVDINSMLVVSVKELRTSIEIQSIFSKDTLSIDKTILDEIVENSEKYKSHDKEKETECLLISKIYEKINVLQLNDIDTSELNEKLSEGNLTVSVLKEILNDLHNKYPVLHEKTIEAYEPKIFEEIFEKTDNQIEELLELIESVLEIKSLSKQNKDYVLNVRELLQSKKDHILDLEKEKNMISSMYVSDDDAFIFLKQTILNNIDNFNINEQKQQELLDYVEFISNSDIESFLKITKLNEFCEKLI